jgi:hypothetical protein
VIKSDPSATEIAGLADLRALRHPDPHSILGPHPSNGGLVIRVFNPLAREVSLLVGGLAPKSMRQLNGD